MAKAHSYTITKDNNKSEHEAIAYLLKKDKRFVAPDSATRKMLLEELGVDPKLSRAFDLVRLKQAAKRGERIEVHHLEGLTFVELKTTKKKLADNPKGFFFGATENEFKLAKKLGQKFRFCFVSLHPESKTHAMLTLEELEGMIKSKRVQYQINLKTR